MEGFINIIIIIETLDNFLLISGKYLEMQICPSSFSLSLGSLCNCLIDTKFSIDAIVNSYSGIYLCCKVIYCVTSPLYLDWSWTEGNVLDLGIIAFVGGIYLGNNKMCK